MATRNQTQANGAGQINDISHKACFFIGQDYDAKLNIFLHTANLKRIDVLSFIKKWRGAVFVRTFATQMKRKR